MRDFPWKVFVNCLTVIVMLSSANHQILVLQIKISNKTKQNKTAVSDNGFKIMCLLYLTPILPLGPVSYMCGTTSMPLAKFAAAKIAALPLMLLYVLIGASTDTFMGGDEMEDRKGASVIAVGGKENVQVGVDEDMHRKMVLFGLCLSIVSMTTVSHFVKKELYKVGSVDISTEFLLFIYVVLRKE